MEEQCDSRGINKMFTGPELTRMMQSLNSQLFILSNKIYDTIRKFPVFKFPFGGMSCL